MKPSEVAPKCSSAMRKMIEKMDQWYFRCVEGGVDVGKRLTQMKWDLIAFTGGSSIGKLVAAEAGKNLVPCVLELGGWNPCVIDESADLDLAVWKVVLGWFINSGQICTGPDMIYVPEKLSDEFFKLLKKHIEETFKSSTMTKVINEFHCKRILSYLEGHGGEYILGSGKYDAKT
jgi:aldehyde dehydrogenase (NAD+)